MNRSVPLITLLLLSCLSVLAQPGNVKKEDNLPATSYRNPGDSLIEAKLVELALKGPRYRATNHQNRINELELKKAKNAWLNLLSVSYNVNDQTFKQPVTTPGTTTNVYPKYTFGVVLPLGIIFSQGSQVKTARESVAYSKDMQEELARSIKADILSKYRQYSKYDKLIEMQSELINDVLANASQAEDNFKKGLIKVEEYITALKTKNEELAKNMDLRLQQDLLKIEIERIIGVPLEEVLHPPVLPASK